MSNVRGDSSRWVRALRRRAGAVKRSVLPDREVAAWRRACRQAERTPRFESGRIRLLDYDVEYVDLLTLCPQFHDIFVRETLRVSLRTDAPRILDCGANVGLASLYFRARYPGARITAFEADPRIADVLARNLGRNGAGDVKIVRAAVWESTGDVDFRCEGADSGAVGAVAGALRGDERSVRSVRLRDVLAREEVDVLKLDIEGAERTVLEDCEDVLGNVHVLLMELHELDISRRCTSSVLDLLDRAGYLWSLDDLTPLPWRPPTGSAESPFPGTHLSWAVLVRAWRDSEVRRP